MCSILKKLQPGMSESACELKSAASVVWVGCSRLWPYARNLKQHQSLSFRDKPFPPTIDGL